MKFIAAAVAAFSLAAFATRALACGDKEKPTTAQSSGSKETVAKSAKAAKGQATATAAAQN